METSYSFIQYLNFIYYETVDNLTFCHMFHEVNITVFICPLKCDYNNI